MAVGEWDQRQLCSDGGCVGVIGPDGTCKACGRAAANWGDERNRGLIEPDDGDAGDDSDDEVDGEENFDAGYDGDDHDEDEDDDTAALADDVSTELAPIAASASATPGASDWGARRLCPDGACIGLIGLDGRCKVCGRSPVAASPPAEPADRTPPAPASSAAIDSAETSLEVASPGGKASADPESTLVPCNDSACAGVSDRNGHCTVCGKVVT